MTRIISIDIAKVTVEIPIEAAKKIIKDVDEIKTHRKEAWLFEELETLADKIEYALSLEEEA